MKADKLHLIEPEEIHQLIDQIVLIHNTEPMYHRIRYNFHKYMQPIIAKYTNDPNHIPIMFNFKDSIYRKIVDDVEVRSINSNNKLKILLLNYVESFFRLIKNAQQPNDIPNDSVKIKQVITDIFKKLYSFIKLEIVPAMFMMYKEAILDVLSDTYYREDLDKIHMRFNLPTNHNLTRLDEFIYNSILSTMHININDSDVDVGADKRISYNILLLTDIVSRILKYYKGMEIPDLNDLVKYLICINLNPSYVFDNMVIDVTIDDSYYGNYVIHTSINNVTEYINRYINRPIHQCYAMNMLYLDKIPQYTYVCEELDEDDEVNSITKYNSGAINIIDNPSIKSLKLPKIPATLEMVDNRMIGIKLSRQSTSITEPYNYSVTTIGKPQSYTFMFPGNDRITINLSLFYSVDDIESSNQATYTYKSCFVPNTVKVTCNVMNSSEHLMLLSLAHPNIIDMEVVYSLVNKIVSRMKISEVTMYDYVHDHVKVHRYNLPYNNTKMYSLNSAGTYHKESSYLISNRSYVSILKHAVSNALNGMLFSIRSQLQTIGNINKVHHTILDRMNMDDFSGLAFRDKVIEFDYLCKTNTFHSDTMYVSDIF